MSCYEWERGSVIIPSDQWVSVRKDIIIHFNERQTWRFEQAQKIYEVLAQSVKGMRQKNRVLTFQRVLKEEAHKREIPYSDRWRIEQSLKTDDWKVKRPKKKDFPHLVLSKNCTIGCGDLTVTLANERREVIWNVSENNHAVDDAAKSWLGKFVLGRLRQVQWRRGSGGRFTGNDEYNRDDDSDGGGANYVTRRYGPRGERQRARF
jgi:hypothetical protein